MVRLIGISGSLRAASFNAALLRAAATMVPEGATMAVETIRGIPLYDADVEAADGIPPAVAALKDKMAAADGIVLATPEYNNSIPGVFKNAIDWLSRPPEDIKRVFRGKPVALIGATPSGFGTILSQDAWLSTLRFLGTDLWCAERLLVSKAHTTFDGKGTLTDDAVREQLRKFVHGFVDFVRRPKA